MDEGILASGFIGDEAIVLGAVEKILRCRSAYLIPFLMKTKSVPLNAGVAREGKRGHKAPKTVIFTNSQANIGSLARTIRGTPDLSCKLARDCRGGRDAGHVGCGH